MEKNTRLLPLALFCVFSLKILVVGASVTDAAVLFVLGTISAYYEHKNVHSKVEVFEKKLKEHELLLDQKSKEIEEVKSLLSSLKLAQQFKMNNRG